VFTVCPKQECSGSRENQLSAQEIACITEAAALGGVKRVRLWWRAACPPDIPNIVERLCRSRVEEVGNHECDAPRKTSQPLADAGLKRVNISLDTLDADKFKRIARGGNMTVSGRIAAANNAGSPLKLPLS
jgi:cyclic pyranopterin phosphate synthase